MSDQFNMTDLLDEIESTPDLGFVPHNSESEVEIVSIQRGASKRNEKNTDMLTVYVRSTTYPDTHSIPFWVVLPQPQHDAETRKRNNRNLRDFARAFSGTTDEAKQKVFLADLLAAIDVRSNDGESYAPNQNFFQGLRAWAKIDFQEADASQGRNRPGNVIREFTRVSA